MVELLKRDSMTNIGNIAARKTGRGTFGVEVDVLAYPELSVKMGTKGAEGRVIGKCIASLPITADGVTCRRR